MSRRLGREREASMRNGGDGDLRRMEADLRRMEETAM